ncbi:hypothetical protein GF407_10095 [candidate division KSB1 bacterium]|nr:hypothetical protein [candidate division KSB1 bacterium]
MKSLHHWAQDLSELDELIGADFAHLSLNSLYNVTNSLITKEGHTFLIRKCTEPEGLYKTIFDALRIDYGPCKTGEYTIKIYRDPKVVSKIKDSRKSIK